ncbi:predicted protein [Pyrenophora tritici-repentis Pt-1C-BFP]|uniref:Uncharacterized protein n=1 Tax=Pyrenophora tritici-repentis (strain Pt-1C-BFP) TaxID=426418 RepID=B2WFM4_PYRTR|nr:uncharacterized protein PTRG_08730 [Pyrenophora tritici-repentis Pt-1C-BFP]EDU41781.1 predicted protein [Pyrenophora tritici-repentis Pt-1C-BFP]
MTITTLQVNAFLSRVSGQEGGVRGHMKRGDNGEAGKRNVFFVEVRLYSLGILQRQVIAIVEPTDKAICSASQVLLPDGMWR